MHAEHGRIYDAIRDKDVEAARSAMRTHLSNSLQRAHPTAPRRRR